jgi:hypothetical protein
MRWTKDAIGREMAKRDPVDLSALRNAARSPEATALLARVLERDHGAGPAPDPGPEPELAPPAAPSPAGAAAEAESEAPVPGAPVVPIGQGGRGAAGRARGSLPPTSGPGEPRFPGRWGAAVVTVAACGVLMAGGYLVLVSSRGPQPQRTVTDWHSARALAPSEAPLAPGGPAAPTAPWRLVSDVEPSGWRLGTPGPAPGELTCASATTCYVTGTAADTSSANSVLDTLYVSTDGGFGWAVLPLPAGFSFTTALSCPGAETCNGGGMERGRPVMIATVDGGHRWTVTPLGGLGTLVSLTCTSAAACDGLVAPPPDAARILQSEPAEAPDEAFVQTVDAGAAWSVHPFAATDRLVTMSCQTAADCTAIGYPATDGLGLTRPAGFVLSSSDGGATWRTSALPTGIAIDYLSALSCGDASHCMVLGSARFVTTETECVGTPPHEPATSPAPGQVAMCSVGPSTTSVTKVLVTTDGARTWHVRALPADVPVPQLDSVRCVSSTTCWAAGSEKVRQQTGRSAGSSAVFVGTTDGGATWSKVAVTVPATAPNDQGGDAYMSVGGISCPSASVCVALGVVDIGSKFVPVYRFDSGN